MLVHPDGVIERVPVGTVVRVRRWNDPSRRGSQAHVNRFAVAAAIDVRRLLQDAEPRGQLSQPRRDRPTLPPVQHGADHLAGRPVMMDQLRAPH